MRQVSFRFLRSSSLAMAMLALLASSACTLIPDWMPFPPNGSLVLAERGAARYRIVIAREAPASVRHAADELKKFLDEIAGAEFSVVTDETPPEPLEILLGKSARLEEIDLKIDFARLGDEGYILRTAGPRLVIAGNARRGTLYGVYGLLEDHLGCRWFAPGVSRIPPRHDLLRVGPLNEMVIPPLEYREPFVADCWDADWTARNRMNSNRAPLDEKRGGKIIYHGFVHTFDALVPPNRYFDEHPEYFSLVKGQRLKERSQLCCTNRDVIRIVTEEVRRLMRENPDATVFSVSQNDWHNYCECEPCQKLAEREGSQIAPVLALVNVVAEAVEEEFPEKAIDTLAYQWTRQAPREMRPRPNVIVRLCSIECCFSHPLATCDSTQNQNFRRDMKAWAKVSDRLWVWNYNTDFSHYFMPFPNRRVLRPNVRFYVDHNVRGIFEQDTYTTRNGEFSMLGAYLEAKFLWNPDADADRAMDEFLEAYYGPAAPFLRQYIDLLEDEVADENIHMLIWQAPGADYLTEKILAETQALFDRAEAAVAEMPEFARRVRVERLSPTYASIEEMKHGPVPAERIDRENFALLPDPEMTRRVEWFLGALEEAKVERLNEWGLPPSEYAKNIEPYLKARSLTPQKGKNVPGLVSGLHYEYYELSPDLDRPPNLTRMEPAGQGTADIVSADFRKRDECIGLRFTGYVAVEEPGIYGMHVRSAGGAMVSIDGQNIISDYYPHRLRARSGYVALEPGHHRIQIQYYHAWGKPFLEALGQGPNGNVDKIPATVFWHRPPEKDSK